MTIFSSFRPHKDSPAYRENQIRAHKSWEPLVDNIVYLNDVEPELAGANTRFMPALNWPHIWEVAELAAKCVEPSAIVNADIVLAEAVVPVFQIVKGTSVSAATSRRFELETGLLNPQDKGRDIFICKPRVWGMVAKEIPRSCRIGHQMWDAWMVGFLRKRLGKRFADFTQVRCVFHPKHEDRRMPYSAEIGVDGPYYGWYDGTQDTQIV